MVCFCGLALDYTFCFMHRKVLSQPGLYLSFLLTLLIISPIIYWNINNHFITFTYHSNRVEVHRFQHQFQQLSASVFRTIVLQQSYQCIHCNRSIIFIQKQTIPATTFLSHISAHGLAHHYCCCASFPFQSRASTLERARVFISVFHRSRLYRCKS